MDTYSYIIYSKLTIRNACGTQPTASSASAAVAVFEIGMW